jgi:hypothetical protein
MRLLWTAGGLAHEEPDSLITGVTNLIGGGAMNRLKTLALTAGHVCGLAAFALGIGLTSDPAWALNGVLTLHDCTDDQAARLHRAFAYVKTDFLTNPGPMLEALKGFYSQGQSEGGDDIHTSRPMGFINSGYPEYVMSLMAEDVPTEIYCNMDANSGVPRDGVESINLTASAVSGTDLGIAGMIEHEIAHNKGFHHLHPSSDSSYSAPVSFQMFVGIGTTPRNANFRAQHSPETMLAPWASTSGRSIPATRISMSSASI